MTKQILDRIINVLHGFPSLCQDRKTPQRRTTYRILSKKRQCIEIKEQDACVLVRFTAPVSQFTNPAVPVRDLSKNQNFKQWKTEVKFKSVADVDNAKPMFQSVYSYAIGDK